MQVYCGEEGILVLAEILCDRRIAEVYARGALMIDALPKYGRYLKSCGNNWRPSVNKQVERIMAWICAACPVCIMRRRWPRARVSRGLAWVERGCPFCRAYARIHARSAAAPEHHHHGAAQHG